MASTTSSDTRLAGAAFGSGHALFPIAGFDAGSLSMGSVIFD
jgi:hypothetical protein